MIEIVDRLRATRSKNDKVAILKELENADPRYKLFLKTIYDPFQVSGISNVAPEEPGEQTFIETVDEFLGLHDNLSSRKLTGNAARDEVSKLMQKCTPELQKLYMNGFNKTLDAGVQYGSLKKAFGKDFVPRFEVQLANPFRPDKTYKTDQWLITPKLDGIRAVFYPNKGFFTRQGKEIIGFDEMANDLNEYCNQKGIELLDGEFYTDKLTFQEIQGAVLRHSEKDKNLIEFYIFAATGYELDDANSLHQWKHRDNGLPNNVKYLQASLIPNNVHDIMHFCNKYMEEGFEGAMLRNPNVAWCKGRNDNLLKVKVFLEEDFTIVGAVEGNGKIKGMLGTLIVEGEYEGKKIRSEVGSGFSEDTRKTFWQIKDSLVGKKVEVKFQNITDKERDDGTFSLRFPVYMKLKLDR